MDDVRIARAAGLARLAAKMTRPTLDLFRFRAAGTAAKLGSGPRGNLRAVMRAAMEARFGFPKPVPEICVPKRADRDGVAGRMLIGHARVSTADQDLAPRTDADQGGVREAVHRQGARARRYALRTPEPSRSGRARRRTRPAHISLPSSGSDVGGCQTSCSSHERLAVEASTIMRFKATLCPRCRLVIGPPYPKARLGEINGSCGPPAGAQSTGSASQRSQALSLPLRR